jgi:3-oxoacyl-[acyl-carrier-protein] synthase II
MLFPRIYPVPAPRVVVTGAGIISSLGHGWEENARGFQSGRSNFQPVRLFDVGRQRVKVGAQVELPEKLPSSRLSQRQTERLDRAGRMLLLAAHEAWQEAGWDAGSDMAVILGTTGGGMTAGEAYFRQAVDNPNRHGQQATRAIHYQSHTQARMVAEAMGLVACPICIVSTACASGSDAIGHAWEWIRWGRAERVLTGGYDAHSQMIFAGFDSLQLLSVTTCRPFDASRDGLLLGEGAAILALESYDSARRRGATIIAEMVGYGSALDRHHLAQPQPNGDAALAAMERACRSARLSPGEIDYVNAHGTGTVLNDSSEAIAIGRWAGSRAAALPVSSCKGSIGHLLGAAGAAEAVACLMVLDEQWLPPEAGLERPDPVCCFPVVCKPQTARVRHVLSNSFGFGGANASLIFRRWE